MFSRQVDDKDQRRKFTRRALLVGAAQLGAFGAVAANLFRLQVLDGARYAPLAEENRINVQMLAPTRGRIFDRFGEVLADNREAYRAVLIPTLAGDVRAVVALFSRFVPIPAEEQERIAQRARRQQANVPLLLAGDLTFEQIAEINLFAPQLPGVRTEIDSRRQYYHARTVGHVVGFVGVIERHAMDDDPVLRLPGMRIGKTGVERGLDEELRGIGGHIKHEVDARGRIVRNLERADPAPGADMVLTIDTDLQAWVLQRMARERRAALVAMDVESGEVIAMASVPQFDPVEAMQPGSEMLPPPPPHLRAKTKAQRRLRTIGDNPLVNRTIRGAYPPGSTYKMVVALAALEAGVVSPRERITCEGKFDYFDQVYRCWKRRGHGACDLHRAIRESCDCYFYELARRTGIEAIARMSRRFGLGQIHDCGIAHQRPGIIPDPEWKQARFGKPWLGGETILAGIGQGYVSTTPLQLAVMTARLATGRAIQPTLVRPPPLVQKPAAAAIGVRNEWLEAIRKALTAVVNEEGGTGSNARIEEGPHKLAGKTGTSQVSRASSDRSGAELRWEQRDHGLFVGYAPAAAPRYAVVAIIEHGGSGGQSAAPLVRDVMEQLLERDPSAKPAFTIERAGGPAPTPATRKG
ncbi:MAG: penicillin-binding protein 2 [Hyphomicrobiaceae bacterium]